MTYVAVRFRDHVRMVISLEHFGFDQDKVIAAFGSCKCPICVVTLESVTDMARKFRLMPTAGEC